MVRPSLTDHALVGDRADDSLILARRFAAERDEQALEQLLARNLPPLRVYVRAHLGPELRAYESVSDLVQSTCREILRRQDQFQHPTEGAFRRWLFTTAQRKISNRLEQLRAERRGGGARRVADTEAPDPAEMLPVYERFSSPSHQAELRDEIARVESALDRLDPEERQVVLQAHVVGLSRAEIAAELGKSEGATRMLLHRALARLSTHLLEG